MIYHIIGSAEFKPLCDAVNPEQGGGAALKVWQYSRMSSKISCYNSSTTWNHIEASSTDR